MPRPVSMHRCIEVISRSAGMIGLVLLAAPLFAQVAGQQPPAAQAASAPGEAASGEAAAPGPEGETAPAAPRARVDASGDTVEPQPKATGNGLPLGWTPPPATPNPMTVLRKPIMSDAELAKEEADMRTFGGTGIERAIRTGELTPQVRDALRRYARRQIARMTAIDPTSLTERKKISDVTKDTLLIVRNAAASQSNPTREREFRDALMGEMVKACAEVKDNNFFVRMQAVTILSQLNSREPPLSGPRQPPISYVPAMGPLLDFLEDPQQPEAVKVVAALGVGRAAENAESIPVELRYRAGTVLTQELARKGTHPWYQMRLAEALASIELGFDKNRRPIVIESLMAAVGDATRDCLGRSSAAKALARSPAEGNAWNDKAFATAVVQLTRDMSLAYNRRPNRVEWFSCFENLYLAFYPAQAEDLNRLPTSALLRKGSLTGAAADAVERIRPVVKHVLSQPVDPGLPHVPIPTELIQPLDEFLKANSQP